MTKHNHPWIRMGDFDVVCENGIDYVIPNKTKGLSMAYSLRRVRQVGIRGRIWVLKRSALDRLPQGLVINYDDKQHPLLNVSEKSTIGRTIELLNRVGNCMAPTPFSIDKSGQLVRQP